MSSSRSSFVAVRCTLHVLRALQSATNVLSSLRFTREDASRNVQKPRNERRRKPVYSLQVKTAFVAPGCTFCCTRFCSLSAALSDAMRFGSLRRAERCRIRKALMSNTNSKIWFLILVTGALSCARCATETAEQRNQRYKMQLEVLMSTAQNGVERISGKPRKDWGPTETAMYNALVLDAIQTLAKAEHPITTAPSRQSAGFNPYIATGGVQQRDQPSGLGFRSWHNSDGSSGQYIPYPGGNSGGAIFNSDGSSAQYVPYPGGNGGTVFHSDGSTTTVDPEIGR